MITKATQSDTIDKSAKELLAEIDIEKRYNEISVEKIGKQNIYVKLNRFICEKCGSSSLRRRCGSHRNKPGKQNPTFRCHNCMDNYTHVYDKKQGKSVHIDEYFEILKEEI